MPCRDEQADEMYRREYRAETENVQKMLCGVLTCITSVGQFDNLMRKVDWVEAGVTRSQLEDWWTKHKSEDAARKAADADRLALQQHKAAALAKLTPEERKALGH
jgi:hypothetical protein